MAELFSRNYIFSQYINLNQRKEAIDNFHNDYLDSELNKLGVFLDLSCGRSSFITNQVGFIDFLEDYFIMPVCL